MTQGRIVMSVGTKGAITLWIDHKDGTCTRSNYTITVSQTIRNTKHEKRGRDKISINEAEVGEGEETLLHIQATGLYLERREH